jgi:hypothetical protein
MSVFLSIIVILQRKFSVFSIFIILNVILNTNENILCFTILMKMFLYCVTQI